MTTELHARETQQTTLTGRILVVEDNPADARLITEAFTEAAEGISVSVVEDGERALERLEATAASGYPCLILLDLHLPNMSGHEVLRELKSHPEFRTIPAVVLSGSERQTDVDAAYRTGANAYVTKPDALDQFVTLAHSLTTFWFRTVNAPTHE